MDLDALKNSFLKTLMDESQKSGYEINPLVELFGNTESFTFYVVSEKFKGMHPFNRSLTVRNWLKKDPNYNIFHIATIVPVTSAEMNGMKDVSAVSGTVVDFLN